MLQGNKMSPRRGTRRQVVATRTRETTTGTRVSAKTGRFVSARSRAQAAKTRVELDKQLGEKTPARISRLAEKAPLK